MRISSILLLAFLAWVLFGDYNTPKVPLEFSKAFLKHIDRFENPRVVMAQALHETNLFSSNIWRENKNAFGLKVPKYRTTTAIGTNRGHAVYKNAEECIIDYILWQNQQVARDKSQNGEIDFSIDENYVDFLVRRKYAEDKYYKQKVLKYCRLIRRAKSTPPYASTTK